MLFQSDGHLVAVGTAAGSACQTALSAVEVCVKTAFRQKLRMGSLFLNDSVGNGTMREAERMVDRRWAMMRVVLPWERLSKAL